MRVFGEEKSYRCMARRAAVGIGGRLAQIRGHFLNKIDGGRAAQNARRDAAAEWRVNRRGTVADLDDGASAADAPGIDA
ncbi:MAG TPA: hypothetical protein VKE42_03270 [Candidatus Cybelea sp.]|nr:hypothetical protein [Candidatus Cybelea sp.]